MISFLQDVGREDELRSVPTWRAHQLTGDRKQTWSLFASRNWRLTFHISHAANEIVDLDYKDYR
jgi:addiction module HigA family antidote